MGRKYGVDPTLMMAIAEFETGHGSSYSARVRNNIAGIMDGKRHLVPRQQNNDCNGMRWRGAFPLRRRQASGAMPKSASLRNQYLLVRWHHC
jgi:hypothetical protein